MRPTILVVDTNPEELAATKEVLRRAGYHVTDATTFQEASQLLAGELPDVLIADVRLGAFNGLYLLLDTRPDHPEMVAIITCAYADPVLEAEARSYDAVYLVKPIAASVLLSTVSNLLAGTASKPAAAVRRWPRKELVGGLLATVAHVPATVLDVSYGGLAFEVREGPRDDFPPTFEVDVPVLALSINAKVVWAQRARHFDTHRYGAAITEANPEAVRVWQRFVDGVPEAPGDNSGESSSSGPR